MLRAPRSGTSLVPLTCRQCLGILGSFPPISNFGSPSRYLSRNSQTERHFCASAFFKPIITLC